jgi:hypothetical protein
LIHRAAVVLGAGGTGSEHRSQYDHHVLQAHA